MIEVGDRIETWFSGMPDGKSTVLYVTPYRGKYTESFTHVVHASAPRTRQGWMELSIGPDTAYVLPSRATAG